MDIFLIENSTVISSSRHVTILKIFFSSHFNLQKRQCYELKYLSVPILWQILSKVFLISPARYYILQKQCFQLSLVKERPYFTIGFRDFREEKRDRNKERNVENFTPRFHVGKPNTEVEASPFVLSIAEREREREGGTKVRKKDQWSGEHVNNPDS